LQVARKRDRQTVGKFAPGRWSNNALPGNEGRGRLKGCIGFAAGHKHIRDIFSKTGRSSTL
jgi:hypothetical protein